MSRDICKSILDILKSEMQLENNQCWLYNSAWKIPADNRMYVVVSLDSQKVIGTKVFYEENENGLEEILGSNLQASLSIDILSYDNSAMERKEEILLALNSTFAQQIQEKYSFSIARNSFSFTNTSEVENSAMLNRYTLNFNVTYKTEKRKNVEYYDSFSEKVIKEA